MDGLAAARQGHAEERSRFDFARVQSESPLRTLIVVAALVLVLRCASPEAATSGRLSRVPARIWLGSVMRGLAARSSGQQLPLPRFCCASFQSESPRCTLTVFRVAIEMEPGAGCGRTGRPVAMGAAGCAGFAGADGCIGWLTMFGVAEREEILGSSAGIKRRGARSMGRTSLLKSG